MKKILFSLFIAAQMLVNTTHATPVIYYGLDQAPNNLVNATAAPALARSDFLNQIDNVQVETFEEFQAGTLTKPNLAAGINLSYTGNTTTLTQVSNPNNGTTSIDFGQVTGEFATSGTKHFSTSNDFTINFTNAVNAFGFYATDIGDFGGTLSVSLTKTDGTIVNLAVPDLAGEPNGTLVFFGFTDSTSSYKSVTIGDPTKPSVDGFGIDDITIGQIAQPVAVPEPGTLLLMGLALLMLFGIRRKI